MIGGFLGAGKTTAIARLARHYSEQGKKVGLVTNDQAHDLVDTHTLRSQGFQVGEVPGACFCCKFDDLVDTAAGLQGEQIPDIIIAEPVGSCTDLVATVVEPLRHLHGDQYEIGPLAVLLKPEHGRKILGDEEQAGFSPKAAYIFLKQIEEADLVVINKIDKLTSQAVTELAGLIRDRFPDKQAVAISAREGDGFDELIAALELDSKTHASFMDVDYDVYAEGEAELGWLNCSCALTGVDSAKFPLDRVVLDLVDQVKQACDRQQFEAAHVKVYCDAGGFPAIANLVSSDAPAELSVASEVDVSKAEIIINARVAASPEELESLVAEAVNQVAAAHGLSHELSGVQCFRPGRPLPTHRAGQP